MLSSLVFFLSCTGTGEYLKLIGDIDKNEVSGIEYMTDSNQLWVIEDSGNSNEIHLLNEKGQTVKSITIENAENEDWEDITSDKEGNLYIGDFGNNSNSRKDLHIYKINAEDLDNDDEISYSYKVSFYYPEQEKFPPKKSKRFYDSEAFFEHEGNFYLFTKNRSAKYDGRFAVYKIPNKPGSHAAQLIASLNSCSTYRKCAITAADISPDGSTAVLLSGDKVWLLEGFAEKGFTQEMVKAYSLDHYSQKEGVCYKDNNTLYIADEKHKKSGGMLYEVKISDLNAKD